MDFKERRSSVDWSDYTKMWIEANEVDVLQFPSNSPDLKLSKMFRLSLHVEYNSMAGNLITLIRYKM